MLPTTSSVRVMGPKKNNSTVSKQMYDELVQKVTALENRVGILEDKNAVLEKVTSNLEKELDRLDQYGRRSNVILRNLELPAGKEDETVIEKTVKEIVANQLTRCTGLEKRRITRVRSSRM